MMMKVRSQTTPMLCPIYPDKESFAYTDLSGMFGHGTKPVRRNIAQYLEEKNSQED